MEFDASRDEQIGGRYFERIRRSRRPIMPSRKAAKCRRARIETSVAKRKRRAISDKNGGVHRRRVKSVLSRTASTNSQK